MTYPIELSQP